MGLSSLSLVHLNLTVRDVDLSVAFYRQWFGFSVPPRTLPDGTMFVSNADGFDLALHPGSPPDVPARGVHFGFRSGSAERVRTLRQALGEAGVRITEAYDEPGYVNAKCLDPDGYEVEVYWEE